MRTRTNKYGWFEVTGLELEYGIVERGSLRVLPVSDLLLKDASGDIVPVVDRGRIQWTAKLAGHQVEIRTTKPTRRLPNYGKRLAGEVQAMNALLAKNGGRLLPTGAHPFMRPATDLVLWPHAGAPVYELCQTVFDCRRHGWCNSQGAHLNLPFGNDEEFGKLHAAIRLVLPIIPALAASSPFLEGHAAGFVDARMESHLHHRRRVPELVGSLIPEAVFSQEEYYRDIFQPIGKALARVDRNGTLDHQAANARGAIARFDRGSVEVRAIDTQECPSADVAVAEFITSVVRAMAQGRWVSNYLQRAWDAADLLGLFMQTIKDGGRATLASKDYLLMFGVMREPRMTAQKLWEHLYAEVGGSVSAESRPWIERILQLGCLSQRILKHTGRKPTPEKLVQVYSALADGLQADQPFT